MGIGRTGPNKKTLRLMELSEKYGCDPVEVQFIIMRDLLKTVSNELNKPRSRRSKQYLEAEAKLCDVAKQVAPYVPSGRAAITTPDTTPRLTVIPAPGQVTTTEAWLAMHGPKDALNDRAVLPLEKNIRASLAVAD